MQYIIIESMKLDVESVESTLGGNGISIEDIEKLKLADVKKLYEDNSNEKQKYEDFLEFMKNQNHIIYHIGETAKCGDWSIYIKFVDVCPNTFSGMDINVHCLVSNTSSDKLTYYAPSMYSLLNNGLGIDASPSDVDGYTIESGTQLDTVITFNYPSACLDNLKQMTLICEETEISFYPKTQTKEEFDDFEGVYESYSEYDGHINSMFTVNKISENNYEIYWVCGGQNASDFFSWMGETNASLYDKNEYQAFKLGNTFYYFVSEENRIYDVTNIGEIERSRYWIKVNPTFSDESDWEDTGDISSDNTIEDDGTGIVNDEQTDEYILYDSDKRYIDKSELDIMDKTMLRVARNEIYARHGRIFDSQELKQYFESCSWYKGTISSSEFDESVLNEYEKANAKLISDVENLK